MRLSLYWMIWAFWIPVLGGSSACNGESAAEEEPTEEDPPPVVEAPGDCFEVFGPPGISHSPPRWHNLGLVRVDDSRVVSVSFHNFCFDTDSVVVGTAILDQGDPSPSDDFEITAAPTPGAPISLEADRVEVTFTPTAPGPHRATIRYQVSHGYYDFDLVAQAVVQTSDHTFDVVSEGEDQSYDVTRARLLDEGDEMVLLVSGVRDPLPDAADDEYVDVLEIEFDTAELAALAVDQDHPISGTASFKETFLDPVYSSDVTFVGDDSHVGAIDKVHFLRACYACGAFDESSQTIRGSLRLSVNTETRVAGTIQVRVEGFVPGTVGTNTATSHDVTATFDLAVSK